ncbi:MAG: PhaM family polyhydroxyalkanoate granule multifunctional regulatory protein [Telluria sp.]
MLNQPLPNMPGVTDTLDFVKNLWGGMGVPGMAVPTVSVDDLDKKIADLKAVEAWLALNSSMVRGTIQALEVQRGTLAAIKSMGDAFAKAAAGAAEQQGDGQAAPDAAAQFAQAGAWWNTLQDQFRQAVGSALSPEAMGEATARAQEAAANMAAAMPSADMGKAVAESMARAAGASSASQTDAHASPGAAKARAAKPKAGKE